MILTNNRDRGEFKIRIHEGIIGQKINEKKHEDSRKIDSYKEGVLPFLYIDPNGDTIEANECVKGPFFLGEVKVNPGTGKWCATNLDANGYVKQWGYCINTDNEIKTLEQAKEKIKELQDLNKNITYILGYLKTYLIDHQLRSSILKHSEIIELLRNKSVFPDISSYQLNDTIVVNKKKYTLTEDIELGRYWKPEEIIVKKRLVIKSKPAKQFATNRDQKLDKSIRAYQGILLHNINKTKRGNNRIEKIKECIFPYDYINKEGNRVTAKNVCTDQDLTMNGTFIGPGGGNWCATEVDDTGLMREWGYCTKEKGEEEEPSIWEKMCNAVQYEQWNTISILSKELLLNGYSEKSIFNTLIQICNKKHIAPHFEQIKRLVNIEYIKLYPWVLVKSAKPDDKFLKLKSNLDEILFNKLQYLENSLSIDLQNNLVSKDPLWLLHYYYLVERLIILSTIIETGEFDFELLEQIKKTDDTNKLNLVLLELDRKIKSILKGYIQSIDSNGNATMDFNIKPLELNTNMNKNIIIVNFSSFFGTIQKEKRVLYYDLLDTNKNIVEQLVYYNKSFVEPKELEDIEDKIEEEVEDGIEEVGNDVWNDTNKEFYSNYPELNDPQFYIKLQRKTEFKKNKMTSWKDRKIDELCRVDTFEISTQQQWIANYFNPDTPYKGLLIYWGTGVGKTCASITIAERHLDFYKKYNKKILVILGTSTLENYKKELYNFKKEQIEIKNGLIPGSLQCTKDRYWIPIDSTDPLSLKKRQAKIMKKIEQDYEFITYGSLKGILSRLLIKRGLKLDLEEDKKVIPKKPPTQDDEEIKIGTSVFRSTQVKGKLVWKKIDSVDTLKEERIKMAISEYFSNRLIIIDEIQNIRTAGEGGDQIAPQMLEKVIHYSDDIKLVMMSATPMFNNATEIVYILNLLLENDKREKVKVSDLFDSKDNLINSNLLEDVSRGYISYVRGANPISFPRKLLPNQSVIPFIRENNEVYFPKPEKKMSGTLLEEDEMIRYNPLIKCTMSTYQQSVFKKAILGETEDEEVLEDVTNETFDINGKMISNLVYPTKTLLNKMDVTLLYGEKGFDRCFSEQNNKYNYIEETALVKGVPFLDSSILETYSPKYKKILDNILHTENGIVFIYSEYKKGGSLPLALMLEQNGFEQYVVEGKFGELRVKNRLQSNLKQKILPQKWKYVILDGDLDAKKRAQIIEKCNSEENKEGNLIKVIIGTRVAGEGVDFARLRQIHILNPWDNFSRIDQVIGRGIRNCSHKDLPLEERNVTVFLYSSHMKDNSIETTDEKIHRRAERKDIQMKEVEFVLRNNAVDCASNYLANKYTIEDFGEEIGDKNGSRECGYKDCDVVYECKNTREIANQKIEDTDTYNIEIHSNREVNFYKKKIKEMFEFSVIYRLKHIQSYLEKNISTFDENIFYIALDKLLVEKEKLHDKYHRVGRIVFKNGYYMFQPSDLDKTEVLPEYYRETPLTYKPSKSEIVYKEVSTSMSNIMKWTKEIYTMLDDIDDKDEISYLLDRVKDIVMKQILLEWFIGEYENKESSRQDKIRNYIDDKDILIMDDRGDYPKAIHWTRQISWEYVPNKKDFKEHVDGELFKKPIIIYNFDGYPMDKHVIGRLEKLNDGKEDSPMKQMVFKIIDFSFVENKANLKLDGKACMSYNRGPMNKLLDNLGIEQDKVEKRENQCKIIELALRRYQRDKIENRVWWIESNKYYRLEKII